MPDEVSYQFHFPAPSGEAKVAIQQFWLDQHQVPADATATERANELVVTAHVDGALACVSTCRIGPVPRIGEMMYHYRTLTAPSARMRQVASQVLIRSFEGLAAYNRGLCRPEAVGLYLEIENLELMRKRAEGIWDATRCVYIGNTEQGWHQRVRFFDEATLHQT